MSFLPNNIDLTENRDFSGGNTFLMDTPIKISWDEYQLMTYDQYEALIWWESIFGKKRHDNQKHLIFDSEKKFNDKCQKSCARCGKEFRIPWKNFYGLCEECNKITEKKDYDRFPWYEKTQISFRSVKYDLFNRR